MDVAPAVALQLRCGQQDCSDEGPAAGAAALLPPLQPRRHRSVARPTSGSAAWLSPKACTYAGARMQVRACMCWCSGAWGVAAECGGRQAPARPTHRHVVYPVQAQAADDDCGRGRRWRQLLNLGAGSTLTPGHTGPRAQRCILLSLALPSMLTIRTARLQRQQLAVWAPVHVAGGRRRAPAGCGGGVGARTLQHGGRGVDMDQLLRGELGVCGAL